MPASLPGPLSLAGESDADPTPGPTTSVLAICPESASDTSFDVLLGDYVTTARGPETDGWRCRVNVEVRERGTGIERINWHVSWNGAQYWADVTGTWAQFVQPLWIIASTAEVAAWELTQNLYDLINERGTGLSGQDTSILFGIFRGELERRLEQLQNYAPEIIPGPPQ